MKELSFAVSPQYVRLTEAQEQIAGKTCRLHDVQRILRDEFDQLPEFTLITAPTGTGKSYAFPFPALRAKEAGNFFSQQKIRGLIVLPTNALIAELAQSFRETYPSLHVAELTGRSLDEAGLKGYSRWEHILETALECDLAITNPDIINYALHGGYDQLAWEKQSTGRKEMHDFLSHFSYVVIDEYHLYDAAQIANVFAMVYLQKVLEGKNAGQRYLFVSATPEPGVKRYLDAVEKPYREIVEEIVADPKEARAIHGRLSVHFHQTNVQEWLDKHQARLAEALAAGRKILVILDKLREVQGTAWKLAETFPEYRIAQSTGYTPKHDREAQQQAIDRAHIIVATNKAEVGVNYGVDYCLMEPGKYYSNFVQRFGRVARGEADGEIHVCVPNHELLQVRKRIESGQEIAYYDFLEVMQGVMQSKKFYEDQVPKYLGEYLWAIEKRRKNYETRKMIREGLEHINFYADGRAYRRYKVLDEIERHIHPHRTQPLDPKILHDPAYKFWEKWWKGYLDTYLTFRDASKVVRIEDVHEGMLLEYSLEWILQHKVLLEVVEDDLGTLYRVGPPKERDKDIQYLISTLPYKATYGLQGQFVEYRDLYDRGKEDWASVFSKSLEDLQRSLRSRLPNEVTLWEQELMGKLEHLAETYTRKRVTIAKVEGINTIL